MLRQFHKKMTLLYTLTTGIILSCVLLAILLYSEKLMRLRNEETFQNGIWTLVTALQYDHALSHSWLAQLEAENQFIIQIEENGTPLLFKGAWQPDTDREELIQAAKNSPSASSVNTTFAPLSSDIQQSNLFQLTGKNNDRYQCAVMKLPAAKGYVSLVLLHSLQPLQRAIFRQRCLFALLNLAGIVALFAVSWLFVKKSLRPIQQNKEKQDAFFAAASHELRSPIAVIQASAEAARQNPQKAPRLSSNILSECHRLSRLTEDMLTLARANTPGWSANLAALDVDTLLLDAFEAFEPICHASKLPLHLDLPDAPLPTVAGDRERLLQLLSILLDNALSHSPDTGQQPYENSRTSYAAITIRARLARHKIEIQIIDHGIGIPDEQKSVIFDHFYRGDKSRGDKTHFGLGLGIASELARLHRGKLSVHDTEGGGATFLLVLPVM